MTEYRQLTENEFSDWLQERGPIKVNFVSLYKGIATYKSDDGDISAYIGRATHEDAYDLELEAVEVLNIYFGVTCESEKIRYEPEDSW